MAEALAVVGSVASVIQVVDFCSRCVSKSVELYQSGSGILDENAAIELAADHLNALHGQITLEADRAADISLQHLCTGVAQASTDLLEALTKLKIQGTKTKWKTMRKAIRSVWSKEKVRDLEHKLASFREELNLHITVKIRQQLDGLCGDIESHFKNSTETERRILDSIVQQRDVFEATFQDQATLVQQCFYETKQSIYESNEITRGKVRGEILHSVALNHDEHEQTRQSIQATELEIVTRVNATSEINQAEHSQTQIQIAQLQQALQELTEQMAVRNQELKDTLAAFQTTQNKSTKKKLYERSKLVTVALLALETMYRNLKSILELLQSRAKDLLASAQSSEIWAISQYARRVSSFQENRGSWQQQSDNRISINGAKLVSSTVVISQHANLGSYDAHDVYYEYFYTGAIQNASAIDAEAMEKRWRFRSQLGLEEVSKSSYEGFVIDESPCTSRCLWLLASVTLALETHLSPDDSAFTVLSDVLDSVDRGKRIENAFSNGSFTKRLKADIGYWSDFARARGLTDVIRGDRFDLTSLTNRTMDNLRRLLILFLQRDRNFCSNCFVDHQHVGAHCSNPYYGTKQCIMDLEDGPVKSIVWSLARTGLPFRIVEVSRLSSFIAYYGNPGADLLVE